MKFSKRIIVILLVLIILFVSVMTVTYWIMGDVPEPLITAVATMVTAEGGFLMLIKNADTRHKSNDNCNDENESEDNENGGFDTDSDSSSDIDNGGGDNIPDTVLEGKDRGKEVQRAVKVGVYRRNRR